MLDKIYKILSFIVHQYLIIRANIISRYKDIQALDWEEWCRRFVSFLLEQILFVLDKTKDQKIFEDLFFMAISLMMLSYQATVNSVPVDILVMVIIAVIVTFIWECFTGKKDL